MKQSITEGDVQEGDVQEYVVVVNTEQQHSIWPNGKQIPNGWMGAGITGTRAKCLEYIKTNWTDMRPLSLRTKGESTEV